MLKAFSTLALLLLGLLLANCGGGGGGETINSGSTPIATTLAATSITPTSAILNGAVIPNGLQAQSWFEFGTDSPLTIYATFPKQDAGNGLTKQAVSMTWNGLAAGTTYYYRFRAENRQGDSKGLIESFTTSSPGSPPTVATLSATSVGATGATLNGNVTPNGLATTAWFELGTDPTLTSFFNTPSQPVGSGTTSQSVNAALTGLATGTTYYYRVAASNSSGTSKGSILSLLPGAAPAVTTLAVTSVGATTATLNGNVTPNGLATTALFEWGTDPSMTIYSNTTTQLLGSGVISQAASAPLSGLSSGATFYFRVVASNSSGTNKGSTAGFTPDAAPASAPTGVSALAGYGEVTISWSPVVMGTSYNIYFSTTSGVTKTTGIKIAGVTSPYIVTGLNNGTTYYFVLTAVNIIGSEGSESSEVSATPDPPNPAFSQADLTGIWNIRVLQSGADNGWYYVTASVNDSGIFSVINSGGSTTRPSVPALSITSGGVVTETGIGSNATFHGKMSTSKNLIVGTSTRSGGTFALHVFVKRVPGVIYSNTDLTSTTFAWNKIYTGAFPYWENVAGSIDASLQVNLTFAEDTSGLLPSPQPNYSSISIDSAGIVTLGKEPSFVGVMSPDKKVIVGASSDPPYGLEIIQMRGQTYAQADLAGTSIAFTFHTDSTPSWDYATWLTNSTGAVTGSNWLGSDTGTTPLLSSWQLNINSQGGVTTSGDLTSHGGLVSFGKDLVVIVGDSAPDGSYMTIKVQ